MTFYSPSSKGPIVGIIVLIFVGILGTIFFFSFKECKSSGIMNNGKTSNATDLYQVLPVTVNGKPCMLSLEGVYITRLYNRQGGITQRSGFTDIRLSLRDMATGELLHRDVLGDFPENNTRILGAGANGVWLYNNKDGLHAIKADDFTVLHKQEDIIAANPALKEGLAMANDNLTNLDELFAYDSHSNAIMVTTLSGKKTWLNANTFALVEAPPQSDKPQNMEDLIAAIVEKATSGQTGELSGLYDKIIQSASDFSAFSDLDNTANRVTGNDSCEYSFEGNTVRTITKSNCVHPEKIASLKNAALVFIEPVFLSEYNTGSEKYINPSFLGNDHCWLLHAKSLGDKTDLLLSDVNTKTMQTAFTTKTGILLDHHNTSYNIGGIFASGDTVFIEINTQLFSISKSSGKINWKSTICKDDYYSQLYYLGSAVQNGKRYFIAASSFFTELSHEGIFINGRTDYQLLVIDAATGKTVNKITATDGNPGKLPYYLGMSGNQCWFYSKDNAIHTRSIPDLKITDDQFLSHLKKSGVESALVNTSSYDDAIEDKYVAMDALQQMVYFTTDNGLHYQYHLTDKSILEVKAPEDKNYERWMSDNPYVEFYRSRLQNMYHHELLLPDGRELSFETAGSTALLKVKAPEITTAETATSLQADQFIDGEFLTNAISMDDHFVLNDQHHSPLVLAAGEPALFILHKDKISPEAHQVITKYNYDTEKANWKVDITNILGTSAELVRIYTLQNSIYFIFKTHPDLDDNFTCISVDNKSGKVVWSEKF